MIVQSKVNDSALNGHGDGLGPVGDVQFGGDIFQISLGRVFRDVQNIGDLFAGPALDQFIQDLQLVRAKALDCPHQWPSTA